MRQLLFDLRVVCGRLLIKWGTALDPEPREPLAPAEDDPAPEPEPTIHSGPEEYPSTEDGVAATKAVLAVADLVTNPELGRRLFEAACRIPGVVPIRPAPGDPYDPLEHEFAEVRPTTVAAEVDHVAELLTPGFRGHGTGLIRPARVAVHDLTEA
jgi:hypothetical protein